MYSREDRPRSAGANLGVILLTLTVTFTILKLTGQLSWGWQLILLPLWLPLLIGLIAIVLMLVAAAYIDHKVLNGLAPGDDDDA